MWIEKLIGFSPEIAEKIQSKADKLGISFRAAVRIILIEYFNREGKK